MHAPTSGSPSTDLQPIPPSLFGTIECRISTRQYTVRRTITLRKYRNPDADGERNLAGVALSGYIGDALPKLLGKLLRPLDVRARQQYPELLSAKAAK